ncbi:MAG: ferredoxin, partial [Myxococcales bacterium]|nr:ferredoxin [Myxococcales bacterium]
MNAIVLIDHGSRRAEANAQLEALAREVRARRPDAHVATAHLEVVPPDLAHAVAACVAAGATRVVVHP